MASIEIVERLAINAPTAGVLSKHPSGVTPSDNTRFTRKLLIVEDLCFIWATAWGAIWFRFKGLPLGHASSSLGPHLLRHTGFILIFSVLVVLFANTRNLYVRP